MCGERIKSHFPFLLFYYTHVKTLFRSANKNWFSNSNSYLPPLAAIQMINMINLIKKTVLISKFENLKEKKLFF